MTLTIWHNPRCSKSRQTLALLQDRGLDPDIRLYLKDAPSKAEIETALGLSGLEPIDMMRTGEKRFKELGLSNKSDHKTLINAMAENPILIERPLVITNEKAALGRPPEQVLNIL